MIAIRHILALLQLLVLNATVSVASEESSHPFEIYIVPNGQSVDAAETTRSRIRTASFDVVIANRGSEAVYLWKDESLMGAFALSFDVELSDGTQHHMTRIFADDLHPEHPTPFLVSPGGCYIVQVYLNRKNRVWTKLSPSDRATAVKLRARYAQNEPDPKDTVGDRSIENLPFWSGRIISKWVDATFSE